MTIIAKVLKFFKKDDRVDKAVEEAAVDLPKFEEKKHKPKAPEKTEQVGVIRAKGKKPRAKKTKLQTKKKK
jgi:hypothetical protein|tara:strand:- start:9 stop:221 length:213 start_codon:yes stop_codon:yes gene_type:complete